MDQALNIALFKHWEEQLVDLSDKADKSKNVMDTSDLTRQHLNGVHIVKQQAYEDFHAGFVDQAAKYQKQAKAVATSIHLLLHLSRTRSRALASPTGAVVRISIWIVKMCAALQIPWHRSA